MALWGSHLQSALIGYTGDASLPVTVAVPGVNVARLASNPLINIDARLGAPRVGGGQREDVPIGPYLVTLTPITTPAGAPLATAGSAAVFNWSRAVARVVMGRGGTKLEAWIDWPTMGGRFLVACDALSVNAMALDQETGAVGTPWDVRMGAWATPVRNGAGMALAPRYTMRLNDLAANGGTSGDVFLPPFARRWRFTTSTFPLTAGGDINTQILYRRGGITRGVDQMVASSNRVYMESQFPSDVPTWATTMVVNNFDVTTALTDAKLVFELDLG